MMIRSAFWIGRPKPGEEVRFRDLLGLGVMPKMRALPGVSDAQALWPTEREDAPPDLACQVLVTFADREAMERMLSSPGRQALRVQVGELKELFDGSLSHINYVVAEPETPALPRRHDGADV